MIEPRPPLVYVAGPYNDHGSYLEIEQNILNASKACEWLAANGFWFLSPHRNSAHFETILPVIRKQFWIDMAMGLLEGCDALLAIPGRSAGTNAEIDHADSLKIPVFWFKQTSNGGVGDLEGLVRWRSEGWLVRMKQGKALPGTQLRQF